MPPLVTVFLRMVPVPAAAFLAMVFSPFRLTPRPRGDIINGHSGALVGSWGFICALAVWVLAHSGGFLYALDVGASGALFFILGDLSQLLDTLDGFLLAFGVELVEGSEKELLCRGVNHIR